EVGAYVQASFGIEGAAVAITAAFQFGEFALVGERAVRGDVEAGKGLTVSHVEMLFIGSEDNAVCGEVLAVARDDTFGVCIEEAAHGEVDAAFAVGGDVVEDAADAVQRVAVVFVGENPALGRDLFDRRVETAVGDEQDAFRVYRERTAGVGAGVRDGNPPLTVELDDVALIVLSDENPAVFGGDDAIGVVAIHLPDFFPLLTGGHNTGDFDNRVFARA